MIGGLHGEATRALAGAGADLDRRLGVQRDAQLVGRGIGLRIHLRDLRKDGVGAGNFFWGCVLATLVSV